MIEILVCSNEGSPSFPRGDKFKIILKYTPEPLNQFCIHPYVMEISICKKKGPRPFPKGDKYETAKIHR